MLTEYEATFKPYERTFVAGNRGVSLTVMPGESLLPLTRYQPCTHYTKSTFESLALTPLTLFHKLSILPAFQRLRLNLHSLHPPSNHAADVLHGKR